MERIRYSQETSQEKTKEEAEKEKLENLEEVSFDEEKFAEYNRNRSQENVARLSRYDKNLTDIYKNIIEENPDLKNVEVRNFDTKKGGINAKFSPVMETNNGEYRATVAIDYKNLDAYLPGGRKNRKAKQIKDATKDIALSMGVDPKEALKNKKFLTSFIFLHEFGHAKSFRESYLNKNDGRLDVAYSNFLDDKDEEKEMIDRETIEGINRQRRYRKRKSEMIADGFAKSYMLNHFDDFFTRKKNGLFDKRLETKVGRRIEMDDDFAETLELSKGAHIKLTLLEIEEDGKRIIINESAEGYLGNTLSKNSEIFLSRTEEQKNGDKPESVSEGIESVYLRPHLIKSREKNSQKTEEIKSDIRIKDKEGNLFEIELID